VTSEVRMLRHMALECLGGGNNSVGRDAELLHDDVTGC